MTESVQKITQLRGKVFGLFHFVSSRLSLVTTFWCVLFPVIFFLFYIMQTSKTKIGKLGLHLLNCYEHVSQYSTSVWEKWVGHNKILIQWILLSLAKTCQFQTTRLYLVILWLVSKKPITCNCTIVFSWTWGERCIIIL